MCRKFAIKPAEACVQFSLNMPGINSVVLSTTSPERVKGNIELVKAIIPTGFWDVLRARGLINADLFM